MSSGNWVSVSALYVTPTDRNSPDAWTAEAATRGRRGTNRIIHAGTVAAPQFVARSFGLPDDAEVIARRRLVLLDDEPIEVATSYYPIEIAADTALADLGKIRGGAIRLLADLGHTAHRVVEEVTSRTPSPVEGDALLLASDEPVLVIERVSFNADGAPFQAEVMAAPAKIRRLRYEMDV
ncbi:UTRA domain-containing protein [Streptomyces axinellae]|uniref:UbiC transcription regulator-associated domain-containing protein n=1 Tax=Streptomyces axinellae TaxID=552788 RepID=A0ABN3QM51_9ACTN